jgi:hypothetical protein
MATLFVTIAGAEKKPVALAGGSYGIHEKTAIIRTVLTPEKIVFEDRGGGLDPMEFKQYSVVILTGSLLKEDGKSPRIWSQEEIEEVNRYIEQGGTLIVSAGVLMNPMGGWPKGFDMTPLTCLGAKRIASGDQVSAMPFTVRIKDSPYVKDITKEAYQWKGSISGLSNITTGIAITGANDKAGNLIASILVNEYGKGRVFSFGMELFRMDAKNPDTRAYEILLRNAILSANPLTTDEKKAQTLSTISGSFLVWKANETKEVLTLDFLLPEKESTVEPIALDMAGNEKESAFLHITAKNDLSLRLSLEGDKLISSAELLRRTSSYTWIEKILTTTIPLKKNSTEEIWIRFSSKGISPGTYKGALVCEGAGTKTRVPISIKVWKSSLPEKNLVRIQPYGSAVGFVNSLPTDSKKNETYIKQISAFFSNMQENRIDMLEFYFNQYTLSSFLKINDLPILEAIRKKPELLSANPLPILDFSAYEPSFATAAQYDFGDAIIVAGPTSLYTSLIANFEKILGRTIPKESEEYEKLALWLIKGFREWFESKGAKKIFAKHLDEIGPESIPEWKKTSQLFAKAGYLPYCTWTGEIPRSAEFIAQVNPECTLWQIQSLSLDDFRKIVGKNPNLVDSGDEIWYYGGGSNTYRMPYVNARLMGWMAGYYDLDGYGFWTYRAWHSEGEGICFLRDGEILSSPALEGLRDGIEDAQLYAMLNRKTRGDSRAWNPDKCNYGLVGEKGAILLLEAKKWGTKQEHYMEFSELSTPLVKKAKARLLELLEK